LLLLSVLFVVCLGQVNLRKEDNYEKTIIEHGGDPDDFCFGIRRLLHGGIQHSSGLGSVQGISTGRGFKLEIPA
jgi:hypothetical protein